MNAREEAHETTIQENNIKRKWGQRRARTRREEGMQEVVS